MLQVPVGTVTHEIMGNRNPKSKDPNGLPPQKDASLGLRSLCGFVWKPPVTGLSQPQTLPHTHIHIHAYAAEAHRTFILEPNVFRERFQTGCSKLPESITFCTANHTF